MEIINIKIAGYKNISDIDIKLEHFNALIALNNYGKSNLIEAIEFSNDFIQASSKAKSLMMENQERIPINNKIAGKDFSFDITCNTKFENSTYDVNYSFSFEWIKNKNKGCRITSETLKLKKKEKDAKYFTYVNRNDSKQLYLNNRTGRCDKDIVIDDNNLIINKLLNYDDLFYLDIVKKINNLRLSFFPLNGSESFFSKKFVFKNYDKNIGKTSLTEITNLAELFYLLKKEDNNKYKLLINSLLDLLPDIEYINPIEINLKEETNNKQNVPFVLPEKFYDIRVKIKTNNQETSIKNLSEGSKRMFFILTSAIVCEKTGCKLLCLEELENSIHPALLQRLLIILTELTPNTSILTTSHSPNLIKYLNLDDIIIGIPNNEGIASFHRIKKSKQNKLLRFANDAETNIGDYIFDMLIESFYNNSFWNDFI